MTEVYLNIMQGPLRAMASAPSGRGSGSGTTFSTLLSDRARAADEAMFVLSQVGGTTANAVTISASGGEEAEKSAGEVRVLLKGRHGYRAKLLDPWRLVR
ncbi:hypothetical protein [Paraburkholderia sp. BR13444]|uniref:hypothetical protein n=1 Tax=Paraburkholderia sp. BR13444 TaxID=3236997 RepID=UPI0034CE34E9